MKLALTALLLALPVAIAGAAPSKDCPAPVAASIAKAFPKSTISSCVAEKQHGHDQFEVKLTRADGARAEVDVAPDGAILLVEEVIPTAQVPAAVMKAFAAKYPNAKVDRAEKQSPATGTPTYELAFAGATGRHEATFGADGAFIEEE